MYKIGEFSLLNKVTIKTLRYYNEIGLFIPKVIDKYTGYRYYDEDQLEEFNKISKILLDIGIITELDEDCLAHYLISNTSYIKYTKKIRDLEEE